MEDYNQNHPHVSLDDCSPKNPVFWADPSGADSIYNFDTGQYVINGEVVTQEQALLMHRMEVMQMEVMIIRHVKIVNGSIQVQQVI